MLTQAYQEAELIDAFLFNRYPHMDKIIISEGLLTPFGNMAMTSPDGTRQKIEKWIRENDKANKCILLSTLTEDFFNGCNNREVREGKNKTRMLQAAHPEENDILHIGDIDEIYDHEGIDWIIRQFKKDNNKKQCWPEEYQCCYNLQLAFNARHGSRFLRYKKGAKFTTTNHFIVDGVDYVRDKSFIVPREVSGVIHLAFAKHPIHIKEKVISFNRASFTNWFNNIYLKWPQNPFFDRGFAEGQSEPLGPFYGQLPPELENLNIDYFDEVKNNWQRYLI